MDLPEQLLRESKIIAVVGLSPRTDRPSYRVAAYLQSQGYRIIPVNPNAGAEVLGERVYPDLHAVPGLIDLVDIFRRSDQVGPVVDEAIKVNARAIWMQDGIRDEEAADRARAHGIPVVMDNCTMRTHRRMMASERA